MPTKHKEREYQQSISLTMAQRDALNAEAKRLDTTVTAVLREIVWGWMVGRLAVPLAVPVEEISVRP